MAIAFAACLSATTWSQDRVTCGDCCRGVPSVTGFTSPSIVGTSWEPIGADPVVHVMDVSACASQSPGAWHPPVYRHADWTRDKLGTVFGVTLDGAGNIYVSQTSIYNDLWSGTGQPSDYLGTVSGGVPGAILKLDSATGTPSLFCTLPNSDPCSPNPTCAAGLGNLTYSCAHDCIYCTNFEDGRIYRISMTGAVLEAYSFKNQAIESAAADPADPVGIAPWGTRTWAVGVLGDRLYFSVVNADMSWFSTYPPQSPFPPPARKNEIWSIPLNPATGAFAGATSTLEIAVPYCNNGLGLNGALNIFSNPVSDLDFDADCCIYLAERSMIGNNSSAHVSRFLKFCKDASGAWVQSTQTFQTGQTLNGTPAPQSCAGGVAVDNSTCPIVWASADYMIAGNQVGPYYYGAIGLPQTGGVSTDGLVIDYNGFTADFDKTEVGSVEIACLSEPPCFTISQQKIYCPLPDDSGGSGSGCYTWTFKITNNSQFSAKYLWIPLHPTPSSPITLSPNYINFLQQDGSLLDPGETSTITVTVCGGAPGDSFCIELGLEQWNFEECCFGDVEQVCVTLPECDCGQLRDQSITSVYCDDSTSPPTVTFTYCFTLDNLSNETWDQMIFVPNDSRQAYFFKDWWYLPPLQPGASVQMCLQVINAVPGQEFCFHGIMMHSGPDCCCEFEKCIMVPECTSQANPCDLDGDGVVNGADLGQILGSWGPCPGCLADLNGDGVVDGVDLGLLLGWWSI